MAEETRESARVVRGPELMSREEFAEKHRAGIRATSLRASGAPYRYRAGDTVRVRGAGDWTLATDERSGMIVRLELPELVARVHDATLIKSATTPERFSTLIRVANRPGESRASEWALEDLGLQTIAAAKKITRSLCAKSTDQAAKLLQLQEQVSDLSHAAAELRWISLIAFAVALATAAGLVWRLG